MAREQNNNRGGGGGGGRQTGGQGGPPGGRGGQGTSAGRQGTTKCSRCKRNGHTAHECRSNPANNQPPPTNNHTTPRNSQATGRNQTLTRQRCNSCGRNGHTANECRQNPNSPTPTRVDPGRRQGWAEQFCTFCSQQGHEASACYINPASSAYRPGWQGGNAPQNPASQPFQGQHTPNPQTQSFQSCPAQTDLNDVAQFQNSRGRWNRQCKDCGQWHADCGTINGRSRSRRGRSMAPSPFNEDNEVPEPTYRPVMPELKLSNLKFVDSRSGFAYDTDSEGDVIMLEIVPVSPPVQPQWNAPPGQNWHQQGFDMPFQPQAVIDRLGIANGFPPNPSAAPRWDGNFEYSTEF